MKRASPEEKPPEGSSRETNTQKETDGDHFKLIFAKMCEIQKDDIEFRNEVEAQQTQLKTKEINLAKEIEKFKEHRETFHEKIKSYEKKSKKQNKRIKLQQGIIERLEGQAVEENVWEQLQIVKQRATRIKQTINYVKANQDNPKLIIEHLFGCDEKAAKWGLKNVQDKTPFDAEDSKMIRDLFVKTNLFMRKPTSWLDYWTPTAKENPSPLDTAYYKLELRLGKTSTAPTKKLLEQETNFKQLLLIITEIYTQVKESTYDHYRNWYSFDEFLKILLKFVNTIQPIGSEQYRTRKADNGKIIIIDHGLSCKFLYEFKPDRIVPPNLIKDPNKITLDLAHIQVFADRIVGYMLQKSCRRGILTDGETMLFIQFDKDKLYNKPIWESVLPIKIKTTHIKATNPSCLETMITWILSTPEGLGSRINELFCDGPYYKHTNQLILPTIRDVYILSNEEPPFQWFQVPALKLKQLQNLQPTDEFVLKIYDPIAVTKWDPGLKIGTIVEKYSNIYALELKVCQKLNKIRGFNNCYLDQGEIWAAVKVSNQVSSGQCLIRRAIDSKPLPNTPKTYEKVKKQVQILHRNGIVHNNICAANIIYSREGEVYIIGFDKAILGPTRGDTAKEDRVVEAIFAEKTDKEKYL